MAWIDGWMDTCAMAWMDGWIPVLWHSKLDFDFADVQAPLVVQPKPLEGLTGKD